MMPTAVITSTPLRWTVSGDVVLDFGPGDQELWVREKNSTSLSLLLKNKEAKFSKFPDHTCYARPLWPDFTSWQAV